MSIDVPANPEDQVARHVQARAARALAPVSWEDRRMIPPAAVHDATSVVAAARVAVELEAAALAPAVAAPQVARIAALAAMAPDGDNRTLPSAKRGCHAPEVSCVSGDAT